MNLQFTNPQQGMNFAGGMQPGMQYQAPFQQPPRKKKKWLIAVAIIAILALLGGGGYFAYEKFFAGNDVADTEPEDDPDDDPEDDPEDDPKPDPDPDPVPAQAKQIWRVRVDLQQRTFLR